MDYLAATEARMLRRSSGTSQALATGAEWSARSGAFLRLPAAGRNDTTHLLVGCEQPAAERGGHSFSAGRDTHPGKQTSQVRLELGLAGSQAAGNLTPGLASRQQLKGGAFNGCDVQSHAPPVFPFTCSRMTSPEIDKFRSR